MIAVRVGASSAEDEQERAWVTLAAVDGLGGAFIPRLVEALGSPAEILAAARTRSERRFSRIVQDGGVPLRSGLVARIRAAAQDPDAIHRRLDALGMWALVPWDPRYPDALRRIEDPPAVLYGRGIVEDLMRAPLIAVVGTRRPSPAGRILAMRIGSGLAEQGATVVSGLAVGIDGIAHSGALDAGGPTVAVIGGGLAVGVPRAHRALASRIEAHGVVVSELTPDTPPTRGTFPRRNRIVSGLAAATVVVEAPTRSGALITARLALEQGRPVYAAPGRPGDPSTAGCLALLRETPARIVAGIDELLADLGLGDAAPIGDGPDGPDGPRALTATAAIGLLGPVEASVARELCRGPASIDALVAAVGQSPAVVAGVLTLLQLRGWASTIGPLQVPAGPLLRGAGPGSRSSAPAVRTNDRRTTDGRTDDGETSDRQPGTERPTPEVLPDEGTP